LRLIGLVLVFSLAFAPVAAEAQPTGKVVRIGYLLIDLAAASSTTEAFRRGLRDLAHPGGNVTGLSNSNAELVGKRLEHIVQAVPGASRVVVLWQPGGLGERTEREMLKQADDAARMLGVRLQFVEAREAPDLERAFSEVSRARAHALTVFPSTMFFNERSRITDLAAKNRVPAVYQLREFVEAGGLMSYGTNLPDLFQRAASYVDKILKGAKPADLPVEQPTKFELVINLKTAKALGLTIPQSVLGRADEIIR
jgi:putative tryptophan/tyrosine transport system substrate-binding protein